MGNDISKDLLNYDGKRIVWAWQSNTDQDPWKIPEDQREWTPYTHEQANIIEQAYLDKKEAADLGDYCVLISRMLQYRKSNSQRQRRVRRQVIDEPFRPERFSNEPAQPKSTNCPFGNLDHFAEFLMALNSNCRTFESLELDVVHEMFYNLNQVIKAKKKGSDQLTKDRNQLQNLINEGILNEGRILGAKSKQEAKEFCKLIAEEIKNGSLSDLYTRLMKMYTQEKFLFKRVNNLLREENWKELSNLAPYILYLTKTFQKEIFAPTPEDIKTWGCLYRGVILSQESLSFYEPTKNKYFSWYAFTSTTKSPAVAEKFKSKIPLPGKIDVLFTFDICDCCPSQLANVSKISAYPNEEEVIIAPATLYEIISKELKDDKYYIKVKVLPPNEIEEKVVKGDIPLDGLRAISLQTLKAQVRKKCTNFEIGIQNDIFIKDAVSILLKARDINALTLNDSVFEKFGLVELCEMLQKKNLRYLGLSNMIIKTEAASWLPKKPFKDLRFIHIESSILEDKVLPKLLDSLCGKRMQGLSFLNLRFDCGELKLLVPFLSSSNITYLDFTNCEFTPDNLEDLEQAIPLMQLQYLKFACQPQGDGILSTLSRILPQMSALKQLDFKTDEIKEQTYHAFLKCLPEANLNSLTVYGDIDEDRASLLGDVLAKSKIVNVCLSSTQISEDKLLEIILSRTRMNISVSAQFFSNGQNNFDRIIELLCKYEIYSFKFEADILPLQPITRLISKLPETHVLSLYLPKNIEKAEGILQPIYDIETNGNYEFEEIMHALGKVLKVSKVREICLPEYPDQLQFNVFCLLQSFKLKEVPRNEFVKSIFK